MDSWSSWPRRPFRTSLRRFISIARWRRLSRSTALGTALAGPYRVRLWEGKYREPDVLFVAAKHASRLTENYCTGADLVMEVVSDGDEGHRLDRETKREEYAKARIPEYWIVDPEQARITVLTLDGRSYKVAGEFSRGDQAESRVLPGFCVDVTSAITAKR